MLKCGLNVYTFCKFTFFPPPPRDFNFNLLNEHFWRHPSYKTILIDRSMGKVDGLCTNLDALRNLSVGSLQNYLHALKYAEIIIAVAVNILLSLYIIGV